MTYLTIDPDPTDPTQAALLFKGEVIGWISVDRDDTLSGVRSIEAVVHGRKVLGITGLPTLSVRLAAGGARTEPHPLNVGYRYLNLMQRLVDEPERQSWGSSQDLTDDHVFSRFTERELALGFAAVRNLENWKMPVWAHFDKLDRDEIALIEAAIGYYAGGNSEAIHDDKGGVTIIAPGYYAEIGA